MTLTFDFMVSKCPALEKWHFVLKLELRRLYHFHLKEGTVVGAGRRQTDGCTP